MVFSAVNFIVYLLLISFDYEFLNKLLININHAIVTKKIFLILTGRASGVSFSSCM